MNEEQKQKYIGIGIALAAVFVAWKFVPSQTVKAMALGVGGVVIAKQVPYINSAV